jgi:peptidoglycan/LPS O-acetylase OafA/YrhL
MGAFRLLLALSVVIEHGLTTLFGFHLIDAAGAVWVFFAISGFLITIALDRKYADGPHRLAHFYANRALRLYPSYWVWVLVTVAAYSLLPHDFFTRGFREDGSFQSSGFWFHHASLASIGTLLVAFMANLTGLFADALLSLGFDKSTGALIANPQHTAPVWAMAFMFIGQFWTIGVELCFYALAPLLSKRLWSIAAVFVLSASGYAERAWVWLGAALHLPAAVIYLNAPKYLWIFMIGAALARAYLARQDGNLRSFGAALVMCLAMFICAAVRHTALFTNPAFPWWEFVALTAAVPFLFALTSKNKIDRFLGDLSYPVYVNHFLIIQIVSTFVAPNGAVYAGLSIAIASATVVWIERPARAWKFAAKMGTEPRQATIHQYKQPAVQPTNEVERPHPLRNG